MGKTALMGYAVKPVGIRHSVIAANAASGEQGLPFAVGIGFWLAGLSMRKRFRRSKGMRLPGHLPLGHHRGQKIALSFT